jgi:ribosomal protein L36
MERTAMTFVHIHITEYSVKGCAIVRRKGLNIYVIFSNKKQNIKIYLPI